MKTTLRTAYDPLPLIQGSPEWLKSRLNYVTASQVAAIFGICPYTSREELLTEKLTGKEREQSDFQKVLFERAHKAESACREFVREEMGIDVEPAVVTSKKCPDLLASLDGFSPTEKTIFESKFSGQKSLAEMAEGRVKAHWQVQIQSQLYATGAKRCLLFVLGESGEARSKWVYPDEFYALHIPPAVEKFMKEVRAKKRGFPMKEYVR